MILLNYVHFKPHVYVLIILVFSFFLFLTIIKQNAQNLFFSETAIIENC